MAMMSYVHEVETVYEVVQDPQMVLLSETGVHGVSARREKVCFLYCKILLLLLSRSNVPI